MLKTVCLTEKLHTQPNSAMLLGGFDGLHVGHRRLLEYAKKSGLPIGVMTIVGGKETGMFTFLEREDVFRRAGVGFVFELPFDEIKSLNPEEFLALLEENFSPKLYVCGEDFRFGAKAFGSPETIKERGQVCVEVLPLVELDGEKVSSSTIKARLEKGDVQAANALLGENFFLIGKVKEDRKVGRTLGFPTANILYPKEKFPLKKGVSETRVSVDGKEYKGITNYGARPTFNNEDVLTETYLDGFNGDLYGKTLKVEFVRFLRDIQKFENAERLKEQLQTDVICIRNICEIDKKFE